MHLHRRRHLRLASRPGQSLVLIAVLITGSLAMAALVVDLGNQLQVRAQVQGFTDASALAAAQALPSQANARIVASQYALQNAPTQPDLVDTDEVVVGNWDGFGTFTPGGAPINAVRVVGRRTVARGNPVGTFFAKVLGHDWANIVTFSTATAAGGGGTTTLTKFLIDEEIFKDSCAEGSTPGTIDSGCQGGKEYLEDLADDLGMTYDELISDDGDGAGDDTDWFIQIPPGTTFWVGTGQTGDEALFEILDQFPFQDGGNGNETYQDFLNYNEDSGSWRYDLIDKDDLDPLVGVEQVSHAHRYREIVEPLLGKCQVSPMYKSDISNLNDVQDGVPAVNGLGWRNGLMAYSIEAFDPALGMDGSYSSPYSWQSSSSLPMLLIKIWDPAQCPVGEGEQGLAILQFGGTYPIRLVQ